MTTKTRRLSSMASTAAVLSTALLGGSIALVQNACTPPQSNSAAYRIESRTQLIGGPRAWGEVGDWMIENDKIRVIVQDRGFSRGFGVFGGGIIDADLVRPGSGGGDSEGGTGQDNFGEMFPNFFLEGLEPSDIFDPNNPSEKLPAIEVTNDGSNGEPAEVTVRGYGGDFLALTQTLNEALLSDPRDSPGLVFETKYRLAKGAQYIEMETRVQNIRFPAGPLTVPNEFAGVTVPAPFGDVVLFGAGNKVFMPHEAGYNIRFALEDVYKSSGIGLPALPGLTGEFIASRGKGVSYGFLPAEPEDPEANFAYKNRDVFPDATPHSVHIPFLASAFTGVFQVVPPGTLAANDQQPGGDDEFSYKRYFIIGNGDVATVSDVVWDILGDEVGTVSGRVLGAQGGTPVAKADVVILDADGVAKVTQATSDSQGRFRANLRPGTYQLVPVVAGRRIPEAKEVVVTAGGSSFADLRLEEASTVTVTVVEPGVGPVPAKVSIIGTAPADTAGVHPRDFLFDLSMGEAWRFTDLEPDTDDPLTRRFIEAFDYTVDGTASIEVRPGEYTVVATRGPEYDRVQSDITIAAGDTRALTLELNRVVETDGYVASDFHLHSRFSLDSDAQLDDRIVSYAGEGLEFVVSTDHNFVSDYQPTILELGYERFMTSAIGLELTTIDRGHFNGFPLRMGDGALKTDDEGNYTNTIASRTYGSFQWAQRDPQEIFDEIRLMGLRDRGCLDENNGDPAACAPLVERIMVQANHPRDSILGYFDQYALDQDTLEVVGQSGLIAPNTEQHPEFRAEAFSADFDAIEVFNGKRFEMLRNYRVVGDEEALLTVAGVQGSVDPDSCCVVAVGEVLRQRGAFDCEPEERDCTCTADDVQAQIDAGECETGEILYPGVVEDWLAINAAGKRVVGTANSDSHGAHEEEPGYPRTYVGVASDNPRDVTPADIVQGLLTQNAIMTNAPFVLAKATAGGNEAGLGQQLDAGGEDVSLEVEIRHAEWVVPDRIVVFYNGEVIEERDIVVTSGGVHGETFDLPDEDGFVVVEVSGEESMFPSVAPMEIPPLAFTDVIGSLGDSLGLSFGTALSPATTSQTRPYALTNPVWVDADGDGEVDTAREAEVFMEARTASVLVEDTAPGVYEADLTPDGVVGPERSPVDRYFDELPLRKRRWLQSHLPRYLWPTSHRKDMRRVLVQFMRHNH
jgi:hypothetical protein